MSVPESDRVRKTSEVRIRRRKRPLLKRASVAKLNRVLIVVLAVALGTGLVCRVLRPVRLVTKEQRERARIVAEYNRLHKQNEVLRRQLSYLQTKEGIAQEARKHGFVKPGEISLVIPEDSHSRP